MVVGHGMRVHRCGAERRRNLAAQVAPGGMVIAKQDIPDRKVLDGTGGEEGHGDLVQ